MGTWRYFDLQAELPVLCSGTAAGPVPGNVPLPFRCLGTLGAHHKTVPSCSIPRCTSREAGVPIPPPSGTSKPVTGTFRQPAMFELIGGHMAAPVGHGLYLWLGRTGRSHHCSDESAGACRKPLCLTQYLHKTAIRLPKWNERYRAGSRAGAQQTLLSTVS